MTATMDETAKHFQALRAAAEYFDDSEFTLELTPMARAIFKSLSKDADWVAQFMAHQHLSDQRQGAFSRIVQQVVQSANAEKPQPTNED